MSVHGPDPDRDIKNLVSEIVDRWRTILPLYKPWYKRKAKEKFIERLEHKLNPKLVKK